MIVRRLVPIALVLLGALSLAFYLASALTRPPGSPYPVPLQDMVFTLSFSAFLPLGAFIVWTRPRNVVGWLMIVIGFAIVVGVATTEYAVRALLVEAGNLPAGPVASFVASFMMIPGIGLMALLMLLFPNGRLPSPRWRWLARIAVLNMVFFFFIALSWWPHRGAALLEDEPTQSLRDKLLVPYVAFEFAWLMLMLTAVGGLASLVVRFRASTGVERQQLKWMAYVATVVASLLLVQFFVFEAFGIASGAVQNIVELVLNVAVAGIPVAAAIAIARYRLYDIDVVINRTLVYGALTAILVATYVGLVFSLQALLAPITADSDFAVAASTLAVAGLFRPLRSRVQHFIDRRFYRRKFDAQRTLEQFSEHLRDEVDLEALSSRLIGVVSDTMQPAHVSVWIRGPGRLDPVTISER